MRDSSSGEVTVWVLVSEGRGRDHGNGHLPELDGLDFADAFDDAG